MTRCFLQARIARQQTQMNVNIKRMNRFIIVLCVFVRVWNWFHTLQNQQQICIYKNFNGFFLLFRCACCLLARIRACCALVKVTREWEKKRSTCQLSYAKQHWKLVDVVRKSGEFRIAENENELCSSVVVVSVSVAFFSVNTADKRQILYKRARIPKPLRFKLFMQLKCKMRWARWAYYQTEVTIVEWKSVLWSEVFGCL